MLARRRPGAPLAEGVSPGSPWVGVLYPYTPLHHLLLSDLGRALVMTSGNVSDEPIAVGDDEAVERLGGIADAFLGHDRAIHRRCEDSVVRAAFPVRRSRGFAPGAVPLPVAAGTPILAVGAELKSTFCLARGGDAFLSPHLGDLDSEAAYRAFRDRHRALPLDARRRGRRDRARPPSGVPRDEVGAASRTPSWSACSTTTPTRPPASRSTARRGRRSHSSSTAPGTARTGRCGAASSCAAT